MPRKLSKGYAGAGKVARVVGITEGGTGKTTPLEAAGNLNLISKILFDLANGYAVYDSSKNYPEKYFKKIKSIGFGSFSIVGPATVYVGSTTVFTISNYDSFTNIAVSVDVGAVGISGNKITYVAPATANVANLNVAGKIIQLTIADKKVYKPVMLFPVNNSMNINPNMTLSLGRFDTFPEVPQSFVSATGNGDIAIPDNAIGVILRGKTDGTSQMTVSVNGDTVYFSDIETDQQYHFGFGTSINKMTLAAIGGGYLKYSWILPNDVLASTDWQIATDINFQNIVTQITASSINKLTLPQTLANATQYFARARFNSQTEGSSQWSDAVTFITANIGYPGLEYAVPSYTDGATTGALNRSWNTGGKWAALSGNGAYYTIVASDNGSDALFVYNKDGNDVWTNVFKTNIAKPYKTTTNVCVNISHDGSVITVGWNTAGSGNIAVYTRGTSGNYSLLKTLTFSNVTYHAISKDGVKMTIIADAGSTLTVSVLKDFKNSNTATAIDTIATSFNAISVAMSFDGSTIALIAANDLIAYKADASAAGYSRDAVFGCPSTTEYALALSDDGNSMFFVVNGPITYFSKVNGVWKLMYEIAVQETTTAQRRIATNGDGTRLILGVSDATRNGAANAGTAYTYILDSGAWKLKRELLISNDYDTATDRFGALVDISNDGTYAVVNHQSTTQTDSSGSMCNGFMYKPDPAASLPVNPILSFTTPGIYYVTIPDGYATADVSAIGGAGGGGAGGFYDGSGYNGASGGGGGASAVLNNQSNILLVEAVGGEGGNGGYEYGTLAGGKGGNGGATKSTIQVASGQVLKVVVAAGGLGASAGTGAGGAGGAGYVAGQAGTSYTEYSDPRRAGAGGDNTQVHGSSVNPYDGYSGPAGFTITGPAGIGGNGGAAGAAGANGGNGQVTITLNPYPTGPVNPVMSYWTPGTYTLIVPDGYTKLKVAGCGGGGGAGGGAGDSGSPGQPGGAALFNTGTTVNVTPGQALTVVVGAGGNGGQGGGDQGNYSPGAGASGGQSSVAGVIFIGGAGGAAGLYNGTGPLPGINGSAGNTTIAGYPTAGNGSANSIGAKAGGIGGAGWGAGAGSGASAQHSVGGGAGGNGAPGILVLTFS